MSENMAGTIAVLKGKLIAQAKEIERLEMRLASSRRTIDSRDAVLDKVSGEAFDLTFEVKEAITRAETAEATNEIWRRRIAVLCDEISMEDHIRDSLIVIINCTVGDPKPFRIGGRWIPENLIPDAEKEGE